VAQASVPLQPDTGSLAIRCGILIDGVSDAPVSSALVTIRDGRIASVTAHGSLVAAHAHGAQSIREAIAAGADAIEHASLIDDEGIRLAAEKGVALSMDVYNGDYIDTEGRKQGWPEEFLRKNLETTQAQRRSFTRAHAAGAPIVYGTDAGVFRHGLNARQFPIMVQRGMKAMEAIRRGGRHQGRVFKLTDARGAARDEADR
jgi:imidazolonepropionase-like amidohydrolase